MFHEIRLATEVATRRNDVRNFNIGCAIRRNDGVLISSANGPCNNRMPSAHAEARACRKATPDSIAYVVRVMKNGKLGLAKPCVYCQIRLRASGVRTVFYSSHDGEIIRMDI